MRRIAVVLSLVLLPALMGIGMVSPALAANSQAASHAPVCPGAPVDSARCTAQVVTTTQGKPATNSTPTGYGPAQFHTGYSLPTTASSAQTIAIVDAYDDPNIQSDLNTYDTQFGLPPCNSSNGCFTKVNQTGGNRYPRSNSGWALEISLDVEIAHAMCQNCKILLVEASSSSFSNLLTAVDYAKSHANEVSMSWGGSEFSSETSYDTHFSTAGVVFTASAGDNGYGVIYPAASRNVVAVGGTTLNLNSNNTYQSESVWSGTGSGCSAYETAQTWQTKVADWGQTGCGTERGVADVSADADPSTGAAIYDSFGYQGQKGWFQVGGTSLSSPLIASVYALAGGISGATAPASIPYGNTGKLNDVTSGSNGSCGTIMCGATSGYDGPTGVGTPNGTGGF